MDLTKYAELFRSEAREHLLVIERALAQLRNGSDDDQIAELFRSTHTIKGMAAAMGYASVEQLAHALESVLDGVRTQARGIDDDLLRVLVDGADALAKAIDDAVAGTQTEATTPSRPAFAEVQEEQLVATRSARSTIEGTVRVDVQRLDALLDLTGELVIARDRLIRALEDNAQDFGMRASRNSTHPLARAVHDASSLVSAVQDEVLRLRLVPVHQVFDRFPRLVRDLAREVGKDVTFITEGRDIELDRSLLEALGDPVVHLLRNAIDHGIEPAGYRERAGKPAQGRLVLRAARDRNAVIIQVEDDGRGIDRHAVLERARERGLVPWDAPALDDDQLLRVIAQPGLSTAESVTNISGRGVGIDVVVNRVRSFGGTIDLETEQGRGTRFTLRLPTTLAITRALLVTAGGDQFALSAAHVMEVHEWEAVDQLSNGDVRIRDDVLPLVPLEERFGLPASAADERHLVVVDAGTGRRALLVDEITGHQDIVVKRFQSVHESQPWFSGATLLGDGRPALIVDLSSLA